MPKPKTTVEVPSYTTNRKLLKESTTFENLTRRLAEASQAQREWEAEKRSLSAQVETMLRGAGIKAVTCVGFRVEYVESTSASRIDPVLLLEAGVDADTIAACTKPGTPYSFAVAKPLEEA